VVVAVAEEGEGGAGAGEVLELELRVGGLAKGQFRGRFIGSFF